MRALRKLMYGGAVTFTVLGFMALCNNAYLITYKNIGSEAAEKMFAPFPYLVFGFMMLTCMLDIKIYKERQKEVK